jgi:hypothetical protein
VKARLGRAFTKSVFGFISNPVVKPNYRLRPLRFTTGFDITALRA